MRLTDEQYDYIFSKIPRLCIDIVIKTKDGVLMSKRLIPPYKGVWHLPGGRVLFREPIDKAILPIAKNEIGVAVTKSKFLGVSEFTDERKGKLKLHSVALTFLVQYSGEIKGSYQGRDFKYFKAAPNKNIPGQVKTLKTIKYLS